MNLIDIIHHLTVPCSDNGHGFLLHERITRIEALLENTAFRLHARQPLALVWAHRDFDPEKPFILVSSHVDSRYDEYHSGGDDVLLGTYDNSITNASVVSLLLDGKVPAQVLVAFTGDEERNSRGADQVIQQILDASEGLPEVVVVLDVTEEAFGQHSFSVENLFTGDLMEQEAMAARLRELLAPAETHLIMDGAPDESWQYDEHGACCFSLCLPCDPVTGDMHDDDGVRVHKAAALQYTETLGVLLGRITEQGFQKRG